MIAYPLAIATAPATLMRSLDPRYHFAEIEREIEREKYLVLTSLGVVAFGLWLRAVVKINIETYLGARAALMRVIA